MSWKVQSWSTGSAVSVVCLVPGSLVTAGDV
jgi:hypothetical protein